MQKDLYSINEVAAMLGLHVKTVRNHVRDGKLKSTRVGKQYRITRADLDEFTGGALAKGGELQGPVETEVSSVVEIVGINLDKAQRLTNTIMAVIKGRKEDQALRVETLYDEVRAKLKIIILGGLETTSLLLGMIEHLSRGEIRQTS